MRINLQHRNLRSHDELDRWVEDQILALGEVRQIDEANVRLEWRSEASPPFAVRIHLVTPGPDLVAEGSDHSVRAAFAKAITQLREGMASRAAKRRRRLKGNEAARVGRGRPARAA